jgi:hypothetical protein
VIGGDAMDSMKELEKQAERLLAALIELRRKNRLLSGRVNRLEKAAKAAGSSEARLPERAELARRVKALIQRLEKLDAG